MSGDYISIHVRTASQAQVIEAVTSVFTDYGFAQISDEAASAVTEDEDRLPDGDDWYGVFVGARTPGGWVSVYVDDWQDSGVLAKGLSQSLAAPTLEVWVAEEANWGYTYFEDGEVKDRFADDPGKVAETPAEAEGLVGSAERLGAVLKAAPVDFAGELQAAHAQAGEFIGPPVDALAQAVGLPFEHLMIGYESFFDDDPDDYGPTLDGWPQWRHLAFRHPQGKDVLAE